MAETLRVTTHYLDLSGPAKIRWIDRAANMQAARPVLRLADGMLIVGDYVDATPTASGQFEPQMVESEFSLAPIQWYELNPQTVAVMKYVPGGYMKPTKLAWAACTALTFGLLALTPLPVFAGQSDSHRADADAIKSLFSEFNEAFNNHDAHGVAMLFTEAGDFVTFGATTYHDPANIDKWMQQVFARVPALHRDATLRDIHFLRPDTALLYSDFKTSGLPAPGTAPSFATRCSLTTSHCFTHNPIQPLEKPNSYRGGIMRLTKSWLAAVSR